MNAQEFVTASYKKAFNSSKGANISLLITKQNDQSNV